MPDSSQSLRIVILDCPYNSWSQRRTQELFSSIVEMKLRGYKPVYRDGVMPVDSYDFVATHLLICKDENSLLRPLSGFKSVTLNRCNRFNLPFPTHPLLKNEQHQRAVARIIDECQRSETDLAFDSSWTIDPAVREDRTTARMLHELFITNILSWHSSEKNHEVLGTGILKVRTHRFFQRIGFKPVHYEGAPLPPFEQSSLQGASAVLIHLKEASPYARELADAHRELWENRIVIS